MVETAEEARHDPDLRWFIEATADSFLLARFPLNQGE
jgi:hypothetical protein